MTDMHIKPLLICRFSKNRRRECRTFLIALDGLGEFNIGGQIIQTVEYADDLVLMAKEETVLQGMIDKLIEIAKILWHGNECGQNKSNENFKTTIPSNNYDRPKTSGECGMF
jgi:hypothetical protein